MRRGIAVLLPVVACTVAACTGVPTGGAVHAGAEAPSGVNQPNNIRVPAAEAIKGMGPKDIVSGFRLASQVLTNPAISHTYLADPTWQPDGTVHVVDESGETVVPFINGDVATVQVTDKLVGVIAADGTYQPAQAGAVADVTYSLTKSSQDAKGEWRIVRPPNYLVLDRAEVLNTYRQGYLYFLSPGGQFLVPIRVFLPITATDPLSELIEQLLLGPPDWLQKARVTSALPQTTGTPTVKQSAGVVTVDLPPEVSNLNATERDQASAQVVYTVEQAVPGSTVRVVAGGQLLPNSHQVVQQTAKTWSSYDSNAVRVSGFYYEDAEGATRNAIGVPLFSPSESTVHLLAPAVAPRLPSTAGVDLAAGVVQAKGVQQLYAGPVDNFKAVLQGTSFTTPSWDLLGNLWTVQQQAGGTQQVLVGVGTAATAPKFQLVDIDGDLGSSLIVALKVARDGTRVALITHSTTSSQLWVGRVETRDDGSESIGGFYPVAPNLQPLGDALAWASSTTLEVLANSAGSDSPTAWSIDLDGWDATAQQVPSDAVAIAAAPNEPLVIGTKAQQIEVLRSDSWQVLVGAGASPAYPG